MSTQYRNILINHPGLDCTPGKVYPVLRVEADWVFYIDDANDEAALGTASLMVGAWEPTDEEVSA